MIVCWKHVNWDKEIGQGTIHNARNRFKSIYFEGVNKLVPERQRKKSGLSFFALSSGVYAIKCLDRVFFKVYFKNVLLYFNEHQHIMRIRNKVIW